MTSKENQKIIFSVYQPSTIAFVQIYDVTETTLVRMKNNNINTICYILFYMLPNYT